MARGGRRSKRARYSGADGSSVGADPAAALDSAERQAHGGSGSKSREQHDRHPVVRDVSAGGVVFRHVSGQPVEIALVGRLRPKRWALPKGTPQLGETLEQTAMREVEEETGLLVRVVQPLDQIQYWFFWGWVRHFKTVHFYLMEMVGGDTANHDAEYDVVEWFQIEEALSLLSYPNEVRVVEKAQEALRAAS